LFYVIVYIFAAVMSEKKILFILNLPILSFII